MPPKKKGKKTKAEIEAEKIAEAAAAEQKKIEEAKAAEEAVRKAEEAAKKLEEDRKDYRREELERLEKSRIDLAEKMERRRQKRESKSKEEEDRREWEAYLACSPKPRINDGELNTYVTEREGEKGKNTMKHACECFMYSEGIIEDISKKVIKMKGDKKFGGDEIGSIEKFVPLLRNMCLKKLDDVTASILQHSDDYFVNTEEKEIRIAEKAEGLNIAIWVNLFKKSFRYKTLDFTEKLNIKIEVPKPLAMADVALRAIQFPYSQISSRFGNDDLVLGGILQIDIVSLPPMFKKVKGWVMRPITEDSSELRKNNYPIGSADGVVTAIAPPIKITMELPKGLLLGEEPKVAWFNTVEKRWMTDPITESSYDPETRMLHLNTVAIGAIAVVQDKLTDICYKEWSLSPVMPDEVRFKLKTPRFEVVIGVKDCKCKLLSPVLDELSEFNESWFDPADILYGLKSAGINLMPEDGDAAKAKLDGAEVAGVTLKDKLIEDNVCEEISYLCTSFDFKSSRWNNSIGKGRCCFQVKETDAFTGGSDAVDYNMGMVELDAESKSRANAPGMGEVEGGVKWSLVNGGEENSSRAFDDSLLANSTTEIYLGENIKKLATPEAMSRVEGNNDNLSSTVSTLLRLSRPFSFC